MTEKCKLEAVSPGLFLWNSNPCHITPWAPVRLPPNTEGWVIHTAGLPSEWTWAAVFIHSVALFLTWDILQPPSF